MKTGVGELIDDLYRHLNFETQAEKSAWLEGVVTTLDLFAVWKEGIQYVGVLQVPLKDILTDLKELE